MKFKRSLNLVGALVVFSMLLTACGTENAPVPTATTAAQQAAPTNTAATQAAAPTNTTAPAPAPTQASSGGSDNPIPGVLRMRIQSEVDELDPQKMSFVNEIGIGQLIFEGLMRLNSNLEPEPAAAEKMDVSADGLKYTLTVRQGLKYSDGTPLNAKNFEYAWKRLFDPRIPNKQYSFVAYDILNSEELDSTPVTDTAKIDDLMGKLGVKATDDYHIEFTLKQKAAYFPYVLSLWTGWPSRQDLVEAGGDKWTTDPAGKYYVGNGPFIMKTYTEQGFTMVANPNYRLGAPKLKEIRVTYINDSAVAFQSYRKGELDVVGLAPEDLSTAKGDPVLSQQFIQAAGSCNFYIGFNTQKAPFDNVKVRQAFAQAFDRQDYVHNVEKDLGQVALSFVPPDRPGYAPDIKMWDFDAAAAQKALADAGFPNGQGLPEIKLTYSSSPRAKTRMEWIQNQLKKNLGIDAKLDPVESKQYTSLVKDPKTTPQVFYLGWCQDYPDPQDWLTLVFHSQSTVTHIGWKNEQFDTLTRQADAEPDKTKRLDMYHQAQEILVKDAPAVFLFWDVNPYLVKPYVKGMKENINPQDALLPGFFNVMNIDIAP